MSVKVVLEFSTTEAAQEALAKLNGVSLEHATTETVKPKKATAKAEAAAAVKAGANAPAAPAPKAPTVDEIKDAIRKWAGTGADSKDKVTNFVKSFGIAKMSDTTEAIRVSMLEKLSEEGGEALEDPMA